MKGLGSGAPYARQFVAGQRAPSDQPFRTYGFADALQIHVHELAAVCVERVEGCELLGIGQFIDPRDPDASSARVVGQLIDRGLSFEQLEARLSDLGGRWLLFARIGSEARVYPDAAAQRSIFYRRTSEGVALASQPGLLGEPGELLDRDQVGRLWSSQWACAWPAAVTPYRGVRQLLPNHYLDLATGTAQRFWPKGPIPRVALDDAARAMSEVITGTLQAVLRREARPALPLTGGIDSRVLLACAPERERFHYFTIADETSPIHDLWLPYRLSQRLGLTLKFVWAPRPPSTTMDLLRQNTGELWRDPNERRAPAFGEVPAGIVVLGNVSEVCRAYYHADGNPVGALSGATLAELSGWGVDAMAAAAFDEWLAGLPSDSNLNPLDLFYWESRLGNWASLDCLALDTFADNLSPFNCRRLLVLGLGVDERHRARPYELHRRICELADPATLALPINTTWLQDLQKSVRAHVPPVVRDLARRARSISQPGFRGPASRPPEK